jgi:broad specificity phosphatase PhoE
MLRMLLTRHGQSQWNADGRWQGQADPPLSDHGRRQAGRAADHLGAVDAIVSSDLERAHYTATIISELLGEGPVLVCPDLKERDAGEWSGLTKDEITEQYPGFLEERRRPPGFEDEDPFLERVLRGLATVHEQVGEGEALVVTHGGVIYAIERHLGAEFERIPNLGSRWVTAHEGRLELGERLTLVDEADLTVPDQI